MKALENKIPPPLVALVTAGLMGAVARMYPANAIASPLREILTVLTSVFAVSVAGSAILTFLRARTTIDPVQIGNASRVVSTGVFRYTRNPMYLGLTATLTSWAIWLSNPALFLGPIVFSLFIHYFQILPEERAMSAKFGSEYDAYRARVRRWI